jgi:hypothetical protein
MQQINEHEIEQEVRTATCPRCEVNEYLIAGVEWKRGDPMYGGLSRVAWKKIDPLWGPWERVEEMICNNCDQIQNGGIVVSLHTMRRKMIEAGIPIDDTHPYYLEPADE